MNEGKIRSLNRDRVKEKKFRFHFQFFFFFQRKITLNIIAGNIFKRYNSLHTKCKQKLYLNKFISSYKKIINWEYNDIDKQRISIMIIFQ